MSNTAKGPRIQKRTTRAVTRETILEAARQCFTRKGYEAASIREIARIAIVDPALVIRYFGSKDALYFEAMVHVESIDRLIGNDLANFGTLVCRTLIEVEEGSREHHVLEALLRAATSKQTVKEIRGLLETAMVKPLSKIIGGDDADLRAGVISALTLGLAIHRLILRVRPIGSREAGAITRIVAPIIQSLLNQKGPQGGTAACDSSKYEERIAALERMVGKLTMELAHARGEE